MSRSYRDGGHSGSYKFSNRYTTRKVRRATRDFCNQVKVDVEIDTNDDLVQEPNEYCDFKSGWEPLVRWLESRIDDKWDDVYSDLSTKIKTVLGKDETVKRTVRSLVDFNPSESDKTSFFKHDFYVDDDGLLKKKARSKYHFSCGRVNERKLVEFLNGRIIGKYEGNYYWFAPVKTGEYKCSWFTDQYSRPWNERYLRYLKKDYTLVDNGFGKKWKWDWVDIAGHGETVNTRRLDPLTDEEVKWFKDLPAYYQREILKWSPSNCE